MKHPSRPLHRRCDPLSVARCPVSPHATLDRTPDFNVGAHHHAQESGRVIACRGVHESWGICNGSNGSQLSPMRCWVGFAHEPALEGLFCRDLGTPKDCSQSVSRASSYNVWMLPAESSPMNYVACGVTCPVPVSPAQMPRLAPAGGTRYRGESDSGIDSCCGTVHLKSGATFTFASRQRFLHASAS